MTDAEKKKRLQEVARKLRLALKEFARESSVKADATHERAEEDRARSEDQHARADACSEAMEKRAQDVGRGGAAHRAQRRVQESIRAEQRELREVQVDPALQSAEKRLQRQEEAHLELIRDLTHSSGELIQSLGQREAALTALEPVAV